MSDGLVRAVYNKDTGKIEYQDVGNEPAYSDPAKIRERSLTAYQQYYRLMIELVELNKSYLAKLRDEDKK